MKAYQFKFDNIGSFREQLEKFKSSNRLPQDELLFYIVWTHESRDSLKDITKNLQAVFPDSIYYGNESSGHVYKGKLEFEATITCYAFEDRDTKLKLIWVSEDSKFRNLSQLWKYIREEKGLRAVELIPSSSFFSVQMMDDCIPDISEDITIFGGTSMNIDMSALDSEVIAKGHQLSSDAMAVILYYGSNLNISADYILGWKGLGRYMRVTKSADKVISEIDGMPAFSVYEKYLGLSAEDNDTLVFPLILEEDGVEYIRTPQMFLPDRSVRMVTHIPEDALVRIAYGDKNTILNSLYETTADIAAFQPEVLKAYSCAARKLFWGEKEVNKETLPLMDIAPISGFYSGGEILRIGKKLRMLNSTLVVIGFREGDRDEQRCKVVPYCNNDKSLISRITHFAKVVAAEQQEALNVANEEKMRNDLLHETIHSGKWSFTIGENDEIIHSDYSEEVIRIVDNDISVGDWTKLLHPDDKKGALAAFIAAIKDHTCNTPYDVTYRLKNRYGEYHWFHSAGKITWEENGLREFFGIHIDITDQIEEQIEQKKKLEKALSDADQANRAKTEFLFNMSHDIRTPMNAILGFTNMAVRYIDNKEKALDCLKKTQQSGDLLLSLINSVLEVSRIESGNATLDEQNGDVMLCFDNIEETMREVAAARDIKLTFDIRNIRDRFVVCDFGRCARVFVNIISNAIKYTNPGGYVKVSCEQINGAKKGYGLYRFTFEDNGQGMSDEYQKHVYEQFSREHSSTITGVQGTGLGMAVVKSFVDLMDGTITCKSKLGEGSTFTVDIPFKLQDGQQYVDPYSREIITAAINKTRRRKAVSFKGMRVLLTEDNELNREIAMDILENAGFVVESAENGQIAVDLLKEKGPKYYDFILMDIQMPVMNGYEATRAIRAMYPDDRLPIIAVSANAFSEDKNASMEAGMDAHVPKPIKVKDLTDCLAKFM